jgi:hypothetical protein
VFWWYAAAAKDANAEPQTDSNADARSYAYAHANTNARSHADAVPERLARYATKLRCPHANAITDAHPMPVGLERDAAELHIADTDTSAYRNASSRFSTSGNWY